MALARRAGQSFQIKFLISRNDGHADSVPITACHQRFEDLLSRQSYFCGYGFGRQVVGINLVLPQLISDTQLVEQAGRVGFLGHGFDCKRGGPTSAP